jgi:hypothetical protein
MDGACITYETDKRGKVTPVLNKALRSEDMWASD